MLRYIGVYVYRCKRARLCAPHKGFDFHFFSSYRRPGPDACVSASRVQILQCRMKIKKVYLMLSAFRSSPPGMGEEGLCLF